MAAFSYPIVGYASQNPTTGVTEYDEIYKDHNTMTYRSKKQDREIQRLNEQLENKKQTAERDLKSLIAYYYKKF